MEDGARGLIGVPVPQLATELKQGYGHAQTPRLLAEEQAVQGILRRRRAVMSRAQKLRFLMNGIAVQTGKILNFQAVRVIILGYLKFV